MALGIEWGAKYTLTGPDGTIAVFNDSADPNFVGVLSPESSGLDSPDVREDAHDRTEDDGGIHGNFYYGRRPVVLQGTIIASTETARAERIEKLMRATNAMRADATLKWQPTGATEEVELKLRRQQPLRITKGFVKDFQAAMVSADSSFYGATVTKTYEYSKSPLTMSPSSVVEDAAVGTAAWIEVLNAAGEGGGTAITTVSAGALSKYLKVNFKTKEQIPIKATILGIEIQIRGRFNALEAGAAFVDNSVRVYKEGVRSGSDLASGTLWTESLVTRGYGGAANLWGTTWTPAQLNKEFAAAISMKNSGTKTGAGEIDVIKAVITYSAEGREQSITVGGTIETNPIIKIYGPFENPTIKNVTTDSTLTLSYTLTSATEYLEIDFANRTIKKNGVTNEYGAALNFISSTWWSLIPGINKFEVTSALKSEITYKSAWI
jgi:hypothetical protein